MDNLSIWAKYAAKNHMTYGKCKAAVLSGHMPPPKGLGGKSKNVQRYTGTITQSGRERKAPTPKQGTATCIICGKQFERHSARQLTCGDSFCRSENNRMHAFTRSQNKRAQKKLPSDLSSEETV